MRCERYSGAGGWSSLPGGKRRGRGKRGCRGGTFGRVRLFFRVVLVWRMRGVMRCARWRVFSYPGVRRASAGGGWCRWCEVDGRRPGSGGCRIGGFSRVTAGGGVLLLVRACGCGLLAG